MATDDTVLLRRWIGERDGEAFNELVARHATMVYSACRRVLHRSADAEDVSQDCFLKLAGSRAAPTSSFSSWLHAMATHLAIDHLRRESRRRAVERQFAAQTSPTETRQDWSELEPLIDEAIEGLPLDLRDVIIAHFLHRRTHAQIAGSLGVTRQAVSYRIRKGIEDLRAALARKRALQIGVGTLTSLLGSRMVEAAPAALLASLGKIPLAGAPATASSISTGTTVGGLFLMTKKVMAALALVSVLLSVCHTVATRFLSPDESSAPDGGLATSPLGEVDHRAPPRPQVNLETDSVEDERPTRATMLGVVRDRTSGAPVPGAHLSIFAVATVAGPQGAYRLEGVEKGEGVLTISSEGYVSVDHAITVDTVPEIRRDVELDRQLTVLCVDEAGRPVEGAEVRLAQPLPGAPSGARETYGPLLTDGGGLARFADVPHCSLDTVSNRAIYARLAEELAGLHTEHYRVAGNRCPLPIRVVLRPTVDVAGVVKVPSGFEPSDATVRVAYMGWSDDRARRMHGLPRYDAPAREVWRALFEIRPDPDGRFRLSGIPHGGSVDLVAAAPGLAPRGFASGNPLELGEIVFELVSESVIEGTLRYAHTGEPAVGVGLVASLHEFGLNDLGDFVSRVDETGRFQFRGLSSAPFVVALSDSFDRSEWTMAPHGPIRINSGQTVKLDLFLEAGTRVTGRVEETSTGEPVGGVEVVAETVFVRTRLASAITDDDGLYELRVPAGRCRVYPASVPDEYEIARESRSVDLAIAGDQVARENVDFRLMARQEDDSGDHPPSEVAASGETEDVELTRIHGQIVGEDGRGLPGILVSVYRVPENITATSGTYTDANGRYERLVPLGQWYRIRARGRGFSTGCSPEFQAVLEELQRVDDVVLRTATSIVQGVAVDLEGRPLEGLILYAGSKNNEDVSVMNRDPTDRSGRFRFEHLLPDEIVRIIVQSYDYEVGEYLVAPGSSNLRLVFHRADRSHVPEKTVEQAETLIGSPAPDWDVQEWIQEPAARTGPRGGDGRETILVYTWLPGEWPSLRALFDHLEHLEESCRRAGAVPVLILAHTAHSSLVRPELEKRGLTLGVGIDRFVPRSEYRDANNATLIAYGRGTWPLVFVISADGIVREVESGLEGMDSLLKW